MTFNSRYYATIMVVLGTVMPKIGADSDGFGLHSSVDPTEKLGSSIGTTSYDSIQDLGGFRHTRSLPYDGPGDLIAARIFYRRNLSTDSTRGFGAPRSSGYFVEPITYPRSGMFSSTSSSLHGGSSSGTAGPAAAFGSSAAGVAQSSSLQDGTAGATSGLAATHNVYGANRATGSSAEGGTSSGTGGYGAASGYGYSNYHKGQLGMGNIGALKGYSGYSGGEKAGLYIGNSRPETYAGGYALKHSGIAGHYLGHTDNYGYGDTHGLVSDDMSEGYAGGNAFGRHVGSNVFAGHTYGGEKALEGSFGSYKQVSANKMGSHVYEKNIGKLPAGYVGGFTSEEANINNNYEDVYGEGGIGSSYESGAVYGGRGAYAGSGYGAFGYTKEAGGKQGYGEEEQWADIYVPAIMGGGDSIEGLGTHVGEHIFGNSHTAYAGKGTGISGGAGRYGNLLIGSSSSSGHGGSSSATSGYGAALAASAQGRVHSSSLHDGASEATSGLAAAMGIHGKNKALGSSSEKGTSTGTGGMAAANALGGIKSRMGTFGSSSSSGHGGSSTGTSGFGAAMGISGFGRAQSSSLHDGTSGATSGFGATQSLYGKNRVSGSSSTGGTSSGTGGYGAASGLGYNIGGPVEMEQNAFYDGARRYGNPYGEAQIPMRVYGAQGY